MTTMQQGCMEVTMRDLELTTDFCPKCGGYPASAHVTVNELLKIVVLCPECDEEIPTKVKEVGSDGW